MIFDESYINSRISRSKESLEEAELLFHNEHYLTVIKRLYYAVFYLACAYPGKEQVPTKTHSGTKAKFNEHFLKPQIVGSDFGALYNRLFRERNDTDYGDFMVLSKEEVEEILNRTRTLLQAEWAHFDKI